MSMYVTNRTVLPCVVWGLSDGLSDGPPAGCGAGEQWNFRIYKVCDFYLPQIDDV